MKNSPGFPTPTLETRSLPALTHVLPPIRPVGFPIYVADPISSIETRLLPTLTRSYPRRFTFYVADPVRSIRFECFSPPFRAGTHNRELIAADTAASTTIRLNSCIISGLR